MKKIVITGGSYSGKTSLIEEFGKQGHKTVPEAAMIIINELNDKLGVEGQINWRIKNPAEFQMMIIKKQLEFELSAQAEEGEMIFFDRSIFDSLAYYRLHNVEISQKALDLFKKYPSDYDKVFFLETLSNFQERKETGRIIDKNMATQEKLHIRDVYNEIGIDMVFVEEMSVEERLIFIKKHLSI